MKKIFENIMNTATEIALASELNGIVTVRLISFYYESGKLYFFSGKDDAKTKEFEANDKIAFTTIPKGNPAHIRVKEAKIQLSNQPTQTLLDKFESKIAGYSKGKENAEETLNLYEISITKAIVIAGPDKIQMITID